MNPPDPDPLEPDLDPVESDPDPVVVVLDGLDGKGKGRADQEATEQTFVLDSQDRPEKRRKVGPTLLAAIAMIALAGIGWRVLATDSTDSESLPAALTDDAVTDPEESPDSAADLSDDDANQADANQDDANQDDASQSGANQDDPEPEAGAVGDTESNADQGVDGDSSPGIDSPQEGRFPLFGEPVDWTIAVSVGSEIRFVDTTTGSVRTVPLPADTGDSFNSEIFGGKRFEVFGDRLVLGQRGRVVGVPIGPGASIDFGRADAFYVDGVGDQQRLVVVRQTNESDNSGQSAPEFESQLFGLEGEAIGELQQLPEYPSFFSFESVMSGLVGTYRFTEAGFERLSTGYVVAAGDNHALVNECDEALVCDRVLVDLNDGTRRSTGDIPGGLPFDGFGGAVISPDGRWLVTEGGFGRLVDLETGDTLDLDLELRLAPPFAFSPDGRFVVAVRARNFLVLDLQTGDARSIDVDELGTVNDRSVAVIFADAP